MYSKNAFYPLLAMVHLEAIDPFLQLVHIFVELLQPYFFKMGNILYMKLLTITCSF